MTELERLRAREQLVERLAKWAAVAKAGWEYPISLAEVDLFVSLLAAAPAPEPAALSVDAQTMSRRLTLIAGWLDAGAKEVSDDTLETAAHDLRCAADMLESRDRIFVSAPAAASRPTSYAGLDAPEPATGVIAPGCAFCMGHGGLLPGDLCPKCGDVVPGAPEPATAGVGELHRLASGFGGNDRKEYPCGCTATGPGKLPDYCPTHDLVSRLNQAADSGDSDLGASELMRTAALRLTAPPPRPDADLVREIDAHLAKPTPIDMAERIRYAVFEADLLARTRNRIAELAQVKADWDQAIRRTTALQTQCAELQAARVPREPTQAMLRVNVPNAFNGDQPCSGCLLGEVWRAMYQAAIDENTK